MKRYGFCAIVLTVACVFALFRCGGSAAADFDGTLRVQDGAMQPMLQYSNLRAADYSNQDSDILRFCVYVETDYDTDGDGMADLVKVLAQVPRAAVEGKFKVATIYAPYGAGTVNAAQEAGNLEQLYVKEPFDYSLVYKKGQKRVPAGASSSMEAAMSAKPSEWNYAVPYSRAVSYTYAKLYYYYLVRGFAVVEASGIGAYGSEGFELCGLDLERDSHKCVVEWLTGDRRAFTDKRRNIEIKADWSNGKVAMTGYSYGGTLPFEVATTGVKGLETIIPLAGIASWYDYTNSQGVSTLNNANYADGLAAINCGGTFLDSNWTVSNEAYGSFLWQIASDQREANGNYADIQAASDYSDDWENIRCSALVVHGLNDFNVTTKQADLTVQAFQKAGCTVKLVLHQDGHGFLNGIKVGGVLWEELMNRWLSHYLFLKKHQFPSF